MSEKQGVTQDAVGFTGWLSELEETRRLLHDLAQYGFQYMMDGWASVDSAEKEIRAAIERANQSSDNHRL